MKGTLYRYKTAPHRPCFAATRVLGRVLLFVALLIWARPAMAGPTLTLSTSGLHFGDVTMGTNSPTQTIEVSNTGDEALTITSVSLGGANPLDFHIGSNCSTLAPGESCQIDASFLPTCGGRLSATVAISSTAPGSPHVVALTGTGHGPCLADMTVSPSSLSFGDCPAFNRSAPQTITITNRSIDGSRWPYLLVGITGPYAGDFFISRNPCLVERVDFRTSRIFVRAGSSCQVEITFDCNRSDTGSRSATFFVQDVEGNRVEVPLSGNCINPVTVSPSSLSFGDQPIGSSASQTLTITNRALIGFLVPVSITGPNAGDFSITSNPCQSIGTFVDVRGASSCTVEITFTPTALGTRSATFATSSLNEQIVVPLSGSGIPRPPTLSLSATSLDFGAVNIGAISPKQTLMVANTGDAPLNISNISLGGVNLLDFHLGTNCGTLAPGAGCQIDVSFTPSALGSRSGTLQIISDAARSPHTVSLTGTGVDTQPPTVTCPAGISVPTDPGQCAAGHVSLGTPTTSDNVGIASVTNDAPATFPVGTTAVTWTVTDTSGNQATCTQTVAAVDAEPPAITSTPQDLAQTAAADSHCQAAVPDLTGLVRATDNCSASLNVTQDPAPGTLVGLGPTNITLTVTDAAGNASTLATTFTVADRTAPSLTLPPNQTVDATGPNGAVVSFALTASDQCGAPVSVSATPPSGSTFPVGTTTVNCAATDAHGNTATGSFTVTVKSPSQRVLDAVQAAQEKVTELVRAGLLSPTVGAFLMDRLQAIQQALSGTQITATQLATARQQVNAAIALINTLLGSSNLSPAQVQGLQALLQLVQAIAQALGS
jgi:hypothetical protein